MINFLSKLSQIFGDFLSHFENSTFRIKSAVDVFGQRLVEIGLLFSISSGSNYHNFDKLDVNPGLVVMGGDCQSRGHDF